MATTRRRRIIPSRALPATSRAAVLASADYGRSDSPDWRTVDWRAHMGDVEVLGASVHYVDLGGGEGPPLVLIHGLAGRWQNWLENIPRLAQHRRVVALDLPGFGRSAMPVQPTSISLYADTVDALCDALELGHVAVVGNSMGGFTGAELAIRHPARVERLVLVDAAGVSINELHPLPARTLLTALSSSPVATRSGIRAVLRRPRTRHVALASVMRHPLRMKTDLLYELMRGIGAPGLLPAIDAATSYDFRDRLSEIACPTLIVHGRNDMLVPLGDADILATHIADSTQLLLDDTGHVPMLERPQIFNDALLEFIGVEVPARAGVEVSAA
jgi:pimeloyl-ACP methyl ester carboxylesterase